MEREHVQFSRQHGVLIEIRWRELGYDGISQFIAALDAETTAIFHEGKRARIRLIDFIEEALGRELTDEEAVEEIGKLLNRLRAIAP